MVSRIVAKKHAFASLLTACLLLLQSFTMVPSTAAVEGNSKAVQKVKDDYEAFAKKAKADFEAFKKQAEQNYENLKALAEADYKQLHQKAEADYDALAKRYESRKLDLYYGEINRLGRSLDQYYGEINRLGRALDQYYGDVHRLGRPVDAYYGDVYRLGGALDDYYGEVYRIGKTLHRYERNGGSVSELYKSFEKIKSETAAKLNQRKNETIQALNTRRANTIKALCEAKAHAKLTLSNTRKEITGKGIDFGTFGIDSLCTGQIKLVIDGVEQKLAKPPVAVNGDFLVPMTPLFEALGTNFGWNAKDQSISASKGNASVYMQVNNHTAKVNGKAVQVKAPPKMEQNTAMVPVQFVATALGAKVVWDSASRTIYVTTR
jgi:uncharacterized protein YoxC